MVAYMKSFEIEQMWINKGIEQGISQGIAQGIEQGISQGIRQGITQGIEQGRSEERVNTLREKARADRLERELRKLRKLRGDDVVWFWGEFLGVWAWGLFFCGMNGGRDERTDRQSTSGVWHRRCAGCGWGEFFCGLS